MPVHEAWVLGALIILVSLLVGTVIGHLHWPRLDRLDDEYNAGTEIGTERGWAAGYAQGVEDESRGVAYLYDMHGNELENVPRSGNSEGRIAEESGLATMPGAHAGPGHTIYAELTMLGAQDELDEVLREVPDVDPDWHPAFLARSDAWLAEWRANLGLQEAA